MRIDSSVIFHTISPDPLYQPSISHYATFLPGDIVLYKREFTKELLERGMGPIIYDIKTRVKDGVNVCNYKLAAQIFSELSRSDFGFIIQFRAIVAIFRDSFQSLGRKLNEREMKVYSLIESALKSQDLTVWYDLFAVTFELHDPFRSMPYRRFVNELTTLGYSAIVDVADTKYNSYHPTMPLIIFDTAEIEVIGVEEVAQ